MDKIKLRWKLTIICFELLLLLYIVHLCKFATSLTASIDHIEPYRWKNDGQQGFKVFVTIQGPIPDRLQIVIFSSFSGWDIIRADEEPPPDEPELSSNVDLYEYTIRWHDREKPVNRFQASFWFHKKWNKDEIYFPDFDLPDLDSVRENLRIEVHGKK